MEEKEHIYITELTFTELTFTEHKFENYHFCRGNTTRRKSRFGIIEKGTGTYLYLNKKLEVKEGDIIFIPEKMFCYSKWHGNPEIKVTYINCFMHYNNHFEYEPQKLAGTKKNREILLKIKSLLNGDLLGELEAYSYVYAFLKDIVPTMVHSKISVDKTLQKALEYIINNWNKDFSVENVAEECKVSQSTIYHLFQKELGQTPVSFLNSIKINRAIEYLENSNYSVSEISGLVCFNSENHFRKTFFDITGTTPSKYRKK